MIIRQKQLDTFSADMLERFIDDLEPKIRAEYPEKTYDMTAEQLQDRLRELTREAALYNLDTAQPLTRYIVYRFDHATSFLWRLTGNGRYGSCSVMTCPSTTRLPGLTRRRSVGLCSNSSRKLHGNHTWQARRRQHRHSAR
jgi:hypothetical protein